MQDELILEFAGCYATRRTRLEAIDGIRLLYSSRGQTNGLTHTIDVAFCRWNSIQTRPSSSQSGPD